MGQGAVHIYWQINHRLLELIDKGIKNEYFTH
jgi:hypothetical protein